jgi:undecaprenyl phosphate-alpha-L-ara4FN deformylase
VHRELDRGREAFRSVFDADPRTYAAPAWMSNDVSLLHEESFELEHASDCRGREPFLPIVASRTLRTPQVPDTFPTLDEALGDTHASAESYFADVLARVLAQPDGWHVLTVHAELAGRPYAGDFLAFLRLAAERGVRCMPLREVLAERMAFGPLAGAAIVHAPVAGRHGVLAQQAG